MLGSVLSIECINLKQGKYVLHLLDSLINISDNVFVCASKNIDKTFLKELNKRNAKIILYTDGIAVNRWKSIILNNNELNKFDYIIFADDSMFGPFYPLENIKTEIVESKSDMWGLTLHEGVSYDINDELYTRKDFIQTYFFALAKSVISSVDFIRFLQDLPLITNYEQATKEFEYKLTELVH